VLHEIGHALGIGHSKYIKDVMYFRSAPQQGQLTNRDKATIARLYGDYPVIGFVPKHEETPTPTVPVAPAAFLPPAAPDDSKVVPPMFVPPPVDEDDKLKPPMFVPPPAGATTKNDVPVPMFVPPAVTPVMSKKPPTGQKINVPLFVPPPAK
jgi:hypothetical protein